MPLLFQYGSNCDASRLKRRLGDADDLGRAQTMDEYDLVFDVWSQGNGCAASDLLRAPETGHRAWGVLYRISDSGLALLRRFEGKHYAEQSIALTGGEGATFEDSVITFLVKPDHRREGLWTSAEYVGHIVDGLRAHGVPEEYVQRVIDTAIKTNRKAAKAADDESGLIIGLRHPSGLDSEPHPK
jgi:hypothetical protein